MEEIVKESSVDSLYRYRSFRLQRLKSATNVLSIARLRDETRTRELPTETEITFQSIVERRMIIFHRPHYPSTRSPGAATRGVKWITELTCYIWPDHLTPIWNRTLVAQFVKLHFTDGIILIAYSCSPRTYAILAHNSEPIKFIPHWRVFLFTCTDTGFRFNVKLSFKTENQFKSTESASSTCHLFANTFLFVVFSLFLLKAVIDDSQNQRGKFRKCYHHCQAISTNQLNYIIIHANKTQTAVRIKQIESGV